MESVNKRKWSKWKGVCNETGVTYENFVKRLSYGWSCEKAATVPVKKRNGEYALYKGDDILHCGTIAQIAEKMNVSVNTIRFYASPAYQKRCPDGNNMSLVRIEED